MKNSFSFKRTPLKFLVALTSIMFVTIGNIYSQDVTITPANYTDWTSTVNPGLVNEVTFSIGSEAEVVNDQSLCPIKDKEYCVEINGSNIEEYLQVSIPIAPTTYIDSISFTMCSNKDTDSGRGGLIYGTASPFDPNSSVTGGELIDFNSRTSACSHPGVKFPVGTRSFRFYRRVDWDLGDTAIGDGADFGGSVTALIKGIEIFLYTGPQIDSLIIDNDYIGVVDQTAETITITLPYAKYTSDITSLSPRFVLSSNSSWVVVPTDPQDYSSPVVYQVKDAGGILKSYTVTVNSIPASTEKAITSFTILGETGVINETAKTIAVTIPYSSTLPNSYTADNVDISDSYATLLTTGSQPFSAAGIPSTTTYTVQAEDLSTQNYAVTLTNAAPSTECDIETFSIGAPIETVSINKSAQTISITVDDSYNISSITPTDTLSHIGANVISPAFPTSFVPDVPIIVQAESGDTKTYTVTVTPDGDAPILVSSKPAISPQDTVGLAGLFTLTFDEKVNYVGPITITGGTSDPITPTTNGSTITIPFSGLQSLTNYTLEIPAGAITDIYGNPTTTATNITFRTADGVLRSLPYASRMDGAAFDLPAFIFDPNTYKATADCKASTINQYGAYELTPGQILTITTEKVGSILATVYARGENRMFSISNSANATVTDGSFSSYENKGKSIEQAINVDTGTDVDIYITNTGSGNIYIPYIYISDIISGIGQPAIDEKTLWCK